MKKISIELLVELILKLLSLLDSLLNRKDEKGGEDDVDVIERHRTMHGG